MLGVLYESEEWSSYKLLEEIQASGIEACLINLEEDQALGMISHCDLLVSRSLINHQSERKADRLLWNIQVYLVQLY